MAEGYSSRFQSLNAVHKDHIKHIHQNERMDMIARSKKLQQETNRRRKALVIKRKLESQREEKRRQEILHKRREQQRSATEKYQRLNKTFTPELPSRRPSVMLSKVSPRPASPHSHSTTPLLEEALRAVRGSLGGAAGGHARRSTYDGSASQGSASSSRASSASHVSRGRAGSASSTGAGSTVSGYSQHSTATNGTDSVNRGNFYNSQHHYNPPTSAALNARTAEHARQVAVHTELQSSSLRNLTNSRSRFEAQLEQHQHNLAEHQREALNQFNAAIRQEIDSDVTLHGTGDLEDAVTPPPDITRSESISSVDSLEEEDAPDGKSTPVVPGSGSLQVVGSRFVPEKAGSDSGLLDQREQTKLAAGLHPSPSEGSLGNYYNSANRSGNGGEQEYQSTQNQAGGQGYGNMSATLFSRPGMVATNIPPGSTFMLHRSLSTGANVAVVQPISSANNSQTPNSVYSNQYQKPNTATAQYTKAGAASNGNTNGYYHSQTQGSDALKVAPGGGSHSSVQGKEGAVIGPLCSAQVSRVGSYFVDNTVNQVSQPSQNQFYLSNYNGTSYANNISAANGDAHRKFTNDDFHARTKAWTSPSPHLTSPLSPTGQGGPAVAGDGGTGPFHLTSNTKPYSSRITATNTTLTTGSTAPVSTVPTTYAQNISSAQDNINNGNYGQQQVATNGQYVLHDTSSSQHTPQIMADESISNAQLSYQTGTVYSKGSIPSTVIVSHQPPRPYNNHHPHHHHHHQNPNSTVGTTPAATATTSEPARPEPTKATTQEKEPPEQSSEGEEEQDEEEQDEEDVEKIIKGILKPTYNPNQAAGRGRGRGVPARGGYTARLHQQGRGTGRAQQQAAARDSLEITRDNIGQRISKKSVRFAEKLVEERELVEYESPRVEPAVETTSSFVKPTVRQEKTSVRVKGKPPRPASARVTSTTPKVEVSVRESRAASAGTLRRRPFVRHGAPKVTVSNQTPSSQETNGHHDNRAGTTATTPPYTSNGNGSHVTVPSPQKSASDPVYDGNGLRLDRTPTDDEINWLWDKVRTCLKTSTAGSQDSQSQTTDGGSTNGTGRQPAAVASKYIDGNTLAPQFRTATRIQSNGNSMAATREPTINNNGGYKHGTGRKKVTMEHLSSYGRKNSALLSQRKSTTQVQSSQGTLNTSQGANYTTYKPIYSTQAPSPVAANNQNGDVTESMAAFLTAEALAQQSMSDSQIESAMEEASQRQYQFNANKPYHKAPSAISQEEQRLLQSLERLNERLKTDTREVYVYQNWTEGQQTVSGYRRLTETSVVGGGNYTGRPIPYSSGFRGHQPLSTSTRRHHSAGPAGAAARSQFRVGSAGGNIHNNHGGHVYYH